METRLAVHNSTRTATSRRWHSIRVAVISLALILSIFHCWTCDVDEDGPVVAMSQSVDDFGGKSPLSSPAVHHDQCLCHVSSVPTQDASFAIHYVAQGYRILSMRAPDAADALSPFKPPRA